MMIDYLTLLFIVIACFPIILIVIDELKVCYRRIVSALRDAWKYSKNSKNY